MSETKGAGRSAGGMGRSARLAALLIGASLIGGGLLRVAASAERTPAPRQLERIFHAPGGGPVSFRGELDRTTVLEGGPGLVRFELTMAGEERPAGERVPTDLVVVLDRSGSMRGAKLQHARAAVRALVEQMDPRDRFALVTYAHDVRGDLPLEAAAPAARERWLAVVDGIAARGGTNLSGGLEAGLRIVERSARAGRAPRVLLISDGLANQGDTSRSGLRARAQRAAHGEFVLSTVGVGVDFDGELMAMLADAGTGNFHFLENAVDLAEVFAAEFETARETLASALELRMAPARGVTIVDAAGYPLQREGDQVVLRPGALFAGQQRRIWVTLRVADTRRGLHELGRFGLRYRADGEPHRLELRGAPRVAGVVDESALYAGYDKKAWERGAVVDGLNAVRRRVADAVAAGRSEDALKEVRRYRARVALPASAMGSARVDAALEEVKALESRVEDHAAGRKALSPLEQQRLRAQGVVEGREGSRK